MIDNDNAAFIQTGVSISLAACAPGRRPSMSRGLACKLLDGGRRIGIALRRSQSAEVLENIRLTGRVAVVFSQPTTNRTVQLKGVDACIEAFDPADQALIDQHIADFVPEVVALGTPADMVRALLAYTLDDMVMVVYTPSAGFDQTPGPKAGERLSGKP